MRTWIGLLLVLVVAGCGAPGGAAPVGPAPGGPGPGGPGAGAGTTAAHPYPLTISRTGGFVGVNESITVRADGGWSYSAIKGKPTAQGMLSAADLATVTQTLSDPRFGLDVRPHKQNGVCADGFTYAVSIGPETSTFDDCGEGDRPLFTALLDLLGQRTPF
jgi:hypothetical protein